ncbi:MAG: hypothetical protein HQM12_12650 [SAR324 cluster bacterium]|nr:hypothetical protein [SAR324 cluster bacterium]
MSVRTRNSIEMIPGVTMTVRTMRGVGATYEQFSPHSLDENGAMLVLKGRVDFDVPIRVIVSVSEKMAQTYAQQYNNGIMQFKQNTNGSYQLFGNWLKVKWVKTLDDQQLENMGCNKLLWEIYDENSADLAEKFKINATRMLQEGYTTNVDMVLLLKNISNGSDLEFSPTLDGLVQLARSEAPFNVKMLYCLLAGKNYGNILNSIMIFKERYVHDPFQKRYGILHGTIALNQGDENWERTFEILSELSSSV